MEDIEKKLFDKYNHRKESIKDLREALNLLRIYGEGCELCIHKSIREAAYKKFKNKSN